MYNNKKNNMMKKWLFALSLFMGLSTFLGTGSLLAQTLPFEISLTPLNISQLGGIQSYAFGQADGKWLILGGRLDGLHRRQPWATFDIAGHNNQLIVIDPLTEQVWTAPLSTLPGAVEEQLSSTNMEFHQEGDYLYCIGGYGYSLTEFDHTTYAQMTAVKVPDVIDAIINGEDYSPYFRYIMDSQFQVAGGQLRKIYDKFYLLGGQKFIGRYNPIGPDHGPGFEQEYTNSIRIFEVIDDGTNLSIIHHPSHTDSEHLHRRDYNAELQILPDGSEAITMFSGVFQYDIDLPYLDAVTVDTTGYTVHSDFQQHYNHYHCPTVPMYATSENSMYTLFFGGIAQFYDDNGTLVQDNNVPFVNTIAAVIRDADGNLTEQKLPVEMPTLLGAGAEFIPNYAHPHFSNGVFDIDAIAADSVLLGHIYGGISSSAPNIFFINDGTQSEATSQIFKVFFKKMTTTGTAENHKAPNNSLNLVVYPNPSADTINIDYYLSRQEDVSIYIYDTDSKLVKKATYPKQPKGSNTATMDISELPSAQIYLIRIETPTQQATSKLILER
jgi:hypothetical protein